MDALKAQVAKGPVRCTVRTADQYGRSVATCQLPSGDDAGEFMVKNGLAVAYRCSCACLLSHHRFLIHIHRQYSSQYIAAEDAARAARRGIWQGQFEVPSEWRKRTKAQEALLGARCWAHIHNNTPVCRYWSGGKRGTCRLAYQGRGACCSTQPWLRD